MKDNTDHAMPKSGWAFKPSQRLG